MNIKISDLVEKRQEMAKNNDFSLDKDMMLWYLLLYSTNNNKDLANYLYKTNSCELKFTINNVELNLEKGLDSLSQLVNQKIGGN